MKSDTRILLCVVGVVVVVLAMVFGVKYAYDIMGATVVWSVYAAAVVAIGATVSVTIVSVTVSARQLSGVHGSIEQDLLRMAKESQVHFQDTLTAIRKDGEESRKTILEMHRSVKEELTTRE